MLAFHGKQSVKTEYLNRVKAHALADQIVKGLYWQDGKGCAVGCTIHSSDHKQYEIELGIPEWLARVEDALFEGMSNAKAKKWPAQFLSAIKPGVDLEQIKAPFTVMFLKHSLKSMKAAKFDKKANPQVVAATAQSEAAVKQMIEAWKNNTNKTAARAAAWAARSAAWSAARSAAGAARSAAWSAAWSAESAAESAESAAGAAAESAWSAARSAARSAAWSAESAAESAESAAESDSFDFYSGELLKLLKKAK